MKVLHFFTFLVPCMLQAGRISRRHLVSACLVGPVSVLYITNPHFWQKPPAAFAGGGKGLARPALAKSEKNEASFGGPGTLTDR